MNSHDPVIRQNYTGGDYTNLLDLHTDTVAAILREKLRNKSLLRRPKALRRTTKHKHLVALLEKQNVKDPFSDISIAFQYSLDLFHKFGSNQSEHAVTNIGDFVGTGMLPYPQLLQVSYRVFIRYIIDAKKYLSSNEWRYMADSLYDTASSHEKEAMNHNEYIKWFEVCVENLLIMRHKEKRKQASIMKAPPNVAPMPLSLPIMHLVPSSSSWALPICLRTVSRCLSELIYPPNPKRTTTISIKK